MSGKWRWYADENHIRFANTTKIACCREVSTLHQGCYQRRWNMADIAVAGIEACDLLGVDIKSKYFKAFCNRAHERKANITKAANRHHRGLVLDLAAETLGKRHLSGMLNLVWSQGCTPVAMGHARIHISLH